MPFFTFIFLLKSLSTNVDSRLQTRSTDGSPLVELPPRTDCFVKVREPAHSHETYINRWLEATAASLLERYGRVDVRVLAQIMQLRIVTSSGALLSLERVNEAQKLLARQDLQASGGAVDEFRQLSVRSAILEFKRHSHLSEVILQELTWLQNGTPSLCAHIAEDHARNLCTLHATTRYVRAVVSLSLDPTEV